MNINIIARDNNKTKKFIVRQLADKTFELFDLSKHKSISIFNSDRDLVSLLTEAVTQYRDMMKREIY